MSSLFENNFISYIKREYDDFGIDWSLVDIKVMDTSTLLTDLPQQMDGYIVRLRVLHDKFISDNIDEWSDKQRFIYGILDESKDLFTVDTQKIEPIALQIRRAFREKKQGIFKE